MVPGTVRHSVRGGRTADRLPVRLPGELEVARTFEEEGPDRGQSVVLGEALVVGQGVEHGEPRRRTVDLGHRHGPVELRDRVGRDGDEQVVEGEHLVPVGVRR
jgi:hypothetical protein